MASSIGRALTIKLDADLKSFNKGMKKSETTLQKFGHAVKLGAVGAAAAFGAMGVAALKFGADAAKAAAEDQASAKKLAQALKNTTGATDKQIGSIEQWISKQQMAYGISDTKLRPAYQKLATATGSLDKAQTLTNLAMDVAAGTGKDLDAVSLALAKAYNGNIGALTRLGIPLDANIIKTKDFEAATAVLAKTFDGQAATAADTYQGKLNRLNEGWGEFKEGIGETALPILTRFVDYLNNSLMPTLDAVGRGFAGKEDSSVSNKVKALSRDLDGKSGGETLGQSLRSVADAFGNLFAALTSKQAGDSTNSLEKMANALESIAGAIDSVSRAVERFKAPNSFWRTGKFTVGGVGLDITPWTNEARATGGMVTGSKPYLVGENGPEIFMPSGAGSIIPNQRLAASGGVTYNITMNGIVDGESARRSIERVLQDSSRRSGAVRINGAFV